ncbi:MAG: ActD protein [Myxococcota bacterium]
MNDEKEETPPDLIVERVALGELPPAELGDDELANTSRARIEQSNREILERYPVEQIAPGIRRRLEHSKREARSRHSSPRWMPLALAAPIAAAAMLLMVSAPMRSPVGPAGSERIKGDAQLVVQKPNAEGDQEFLSDDDEIGSGERVQIGYRVSSSGASVFGMVISIDGRGSVTVHHPDSQRSDRSPELTLNKLRALPFSYELDDAPAFERFFLVTRSKPFDVAEVIDAAKQLASKVASAEREALPLSKSYTQSSLILRKR